MKRSSFVSLVVILSLLYTCGYPSPSWGFLDFSEDALKSTGIIIGITAGVLLVIVLIVGTIKDLKGGDEDEDIWANLEDRDLRPFPTLLAAKDMVHQLSGGLALQGGVDPQEKAPARPLMIGRAELIPDPVLFRIGVAENPLPEFMEDVPPLYDIHGMNRPVRTRQVIRKHQFALLRGED